MKIVVVLLALLTAGAAYGTWTFRQRALGDETHLAEQQGRAASLRKDVDRLRAEVKAAEAQASSIRKEIEQLRASLEEAQASRGNAGSRADALAAILGAYHALDTALDGGLRPAYRAALQTQQEFATAPSDPCFDAFGKSVKALQVAVAQTLSAAEAIRTLLAKEALTIDAAKLPRDDLGRILDAKVAAWKGIGAAADATAKSMRRSACAILSNEEWQGAEVDARAGEIVAVAATGKWRWGVTLGNAVGAEGENGDPDYRVVAAFGNGALLARIRGSEKIHRGVPLIQPDREGKVELRINDTAVRDNQGNLDVVAWAFVPFRPAE